MAAFNSRVSGEAKYPYYLKIRKLLEDNAPKSFAVKIGPPIEISIALQTLSPELLNSIYEIIDIQNE